MPTRKMHPSNTVFSVHMIFNTDKTSIRGLTPAILTRQLHYPVRQNTPAIHAVISIIRHEPIQRNHSFPAEIMQMLSEEYVFHIPVVCEGQLPNSSCS